MALHDVAPLEASVEIAAPPAEVWHRLSNLANMQRWSPQNQRTVVLGKPAVGTKFANLNRRGLLVWPTFGEIVHFDRERKLAFRILDNGTVWSFDLEPTPRGTGVVQRREAPDGIKTLSVGLTTVFMGGTKDFCAELQAGMEQTLAALKADIETL
ncbi:SRPBCC family protein [Nocardioides jejuensis]|uniref:SRPBCC family protein n=1 Tax=Nocardioides jejuensis TaxID=2502782 RepID=A0A4R1CJR5_9ACTN|nr:SRPBCC family protein [Nocardioides jejuensis]TCJ30615.1 SRPBCC family protein [Nocardioides jejuensis]